MHIKLAYGAKCKSCILRGKSWLISSFISRFLDIIMVSLGRFSTLYRSTLFQIVIVGLVAFCEPGIWTALNNLGAGGNAKVGSCQKPASGGNDFG